MTIVAAYIDANGDTAIGCDTSCEDSTIRFDIKTKLVRVGDAVVGSSGSPLWRRFLQEYRRPLTEFGDVLSLADAWLDFANGRKHGQLVGDMRYQGGQLLVALPGLLVAIESDGAALVLDCNYAAIGSGQSVAMGALAVLEGNARDVVEQAIRVAMLHAPGCGGRAVVEIVLPASVEPG